VCSECLAPRTAGVSRAAQLYCVVDFGRSGSRSTEQQHGQWVSKVEISWLPVPRIGLKWMAKCFCNHILGWEVTALLRLRCRASPKPNHPRRQALGRLRSANRSKVFHVQRLPRVSPKVTEPPNHGTYVDCHACPLWPLRSHLGHPWKQLLAKIQFLSLSNCHITISGHPDVCKLVTSRFVDLTRFHRTAAVD
jgi:hypothetical protein